MPSANKMWRSVANVARAQNTILPLVVHTRPHYSCRTVNCCKLLLCRSFLALSRLRFLAWTLVISILSVIQRHAIHIPGMNVYVFVYRNCRPLFALLTSFTGPPHDRRNNIKRYHVRVYSIKVSSERTPDFTLVPTVRIGIKDRRLKIAARFVY